MRQAKVSNTKQHDILSYPDFSVIKGEDIDQQEEALFLSDVLAKYNFWSKQKGKRAKEYAQAYRLLLHKFTQVTQLEES